MSTYLASLVLALLPFLPLSIAVVTYRYLGLPYDYTNGVHLMYIGLLILGSLGGWRQGFPRWAYPYLSPAVVILAALLIGRDRDMTWSENLGFKLAILGPALLLFLVAWWLLRKRAPLRRLWQNVQADWTLGAFAVYGLLPIALSSFFTEIRSSFGAPYLGLATLAMLGGALAFMSLPTIKGRALALVWFLTLTFVIMGAGAGLYWDRFPDRWTGEIRGAWWAVQQQLICWAALFTALFFPLLLNRLVAIRLQKESNGKS